MTPEQRRRVEQAMDETQRALVRAASAASAASDNELAQTAEAVVQVLVNMGAPGAQWLSLAPLAA